MTRKEFLKVKRELPFWNNGRQVIACLYGTKAADIVLSRASANIGSFLGDVYITPSQAKRCAFEECLGMFSNDTSASGFHICSRNCQAFTVSWSTPDKVIYLTSKREYIVFF